MADEFEIIRHPRIKHMNLFLVDLTYRNSHLHNDFEICLLLDGKLSVYSEKRNYYLGKNSIILFNPIQPHELRAVGGSESATVLSLQVSPRYCSHYFPPLPNIAFDCSNLNDIVPAQDIRLLLSLLVDLSHFYFRKTFAYELICVSMLNRLFYHILQKVPFHILSDDALSKNMNRLRRMNRILRYIEENYSSKLLLSTIAERENLSLSYLSHFFKDHINMTFQAYLNQVRFDKAKQLIAQTNMKLIDICMECGFSDTRYLNSMFIKQFGCTAREFRENARHADIISASPSFTNGQRFYSDTESLERIAGFKQALLKDGMYEAVPLSMP